MGVVADVFPLVHVPEDSKLLVELITVPLFTGTIGYITNWSGVIMLFQPVRFPAPGCRACGRTRNPESQPRQLLTS